MIKVVAFIHTYAQDGDYGSFMKELMNGFSHVGIKLYVFKVNDLVGKLSNHTYISSKMESFVLDTIAEVEPDFIFSTNRGGITKSIMDMYPDIPRITWMVDRNPFIHNGGDQDDLFRKGDILITSSSANIQEFEQKYPVLKSNVHYFPFMTNPSSFKHNVHKDINISFVGSLFMNEKIILDLFDHYKSNYDFITGLNRFINKVRSNYNINLEKELHACNIYDEIIEFGMEPSDLLGPIANIISNNKRIKCLDAVSDLGLNLYGTQNWPKGVISYSTQLLSCYQYNKFIKTREDLCSVYDRSKIAFNINHHQATTGQGYRVFDILASSALLITNEQENSDLEKIFGNENVIPTYKTPEELRNISQYYLENEEERKELVKKCNLLISDRHTFDKRAEEIVKLVKMNFVVSKPLDLVHIDVSTFTHAYRVRNKIFNILRRVLEKYLNPSKKEKLKNFLKKISLFDRLR